MNNLNNNRDAMVGKCLTLMDKVEDIRKALDGGAFLSALALSLTIPDILSQIEYPQVKEMGKRYKMWIQENYLLGEQSDLLAESEGASYMNSLNKEMDADFYLKLRNAILHSGNTDVSRTLEAPLEFKVSFTDCSVKAIMYNDSGLFNRMFVLSIPDFCNKICNIAKYHYELYSSDPDKSKLLKKSNIILEY